MNIHQPHHPRSVRDKIKLLRRYYNRHPALAQFKELADNLFGRMLASALDRNHLLHSVLEDFTPDGKVVLNGIFSKPDTTSHLKRLKVPVGEFGALARTMNNFNLELSVLSKAAFTLEMRERLRTLR